MFNKFEDFETLAFISLALFFEIMERRRPARLIDKKAELRLDLIALVVLSVSLATFRLASNTLFQWTSQTVTLSAGVSGALEYLRALPSAAKIIAAYLITDFVVYWIHRSMHGVDFMWRTHVWHHTPRYLYWLSGARTSLVHALLYTIPQVLIPFYVFKFSFVEAAIAFPIGVLIQFWAHTNLTVDWGPINWLFVNPVYHRVHHSVDRKYHDSNYGTLLTVWDRLFGTYTDPRTLPKDFKIGVDQPVQLRMIAGI